MLSAFGPVWILTAAGYLARRTGLFGDDAVSTLSRFVFYLAMPAALFLTLSKTPLSGLGWGALVAFAAGTAVAFGGGWLIAARWTRRRGGERPIWAMSAGYVNSANLGIPVATQVLGSVSFLVDVVLLQNLIVTPIILLALDRGSGGGRVRLGRIATLPLRNPVLLACIVGAICSATHTRASGVVSSSLELIAAAAVPTGLIALGGSLHRSGPRRGGEAGELAVITLLKLAVQPLAAFLVGEFVFGLSQADLLAVVVCSGLPAAQNTFIFAQEYRVAESLASRAVLVTTVLSLATLALAAHLVG